MDHKHFPIRFMDPPLLQIHQNAKFQLQQQLHLETCGGCVEFSKGSKWLKPFLLSTSLFRFR